MVAKHSTVLLFFSVVLFCDVTKSKSVISNSQQHDDVIVSDHHRVKRFSNFNFFSSPYWNRGQRLPAHVNMTCSSRVEETCEHVIRVAYYDWCVYRLFRCIRYRNEKVNRTCHRDVIRCCDGYSMAPSGYCEKTQDWGCGRPWLVTGSHGVITTPGYPGKYGNELECQWRVTGPPDTRIVYKIIDLDIENPIDACDLDRGDCFDLCLFDVIKIRDVRLNSTKSLCGQLGPRDPQITNGNQIYVHFESDASRNGRGIKLVYNVINVNELSSIRRCLGGTEWKMCRRVCLITCATYRVEKRKFSVSSTKECIPSEGMTAEVLTSGAETTCIPGCECPDDKPIFENGKCVQIESCPETDFECGRQIEKSRTPIGGRSVISKKILGGMKSEDGRWPWMVQITTNNLNHECGASLISLDWIITAAHCFVDRDTWEMPANIDKNLYWFHVGKYWKNEQEDDRKIQVFRAKRIITHPHYNFEEDRNDIAVVQLDGFVFDIENIRPICLPSAQLSAALRTESDFVRADIRPRPGETCMATGWGTTKNSEQQSNKLKEIIMPIKTPSSCVKKIFDFRNIICAGGIVSKDTCKGDSGGPLSCERDGIWYLDGVTSFGEGCGLGVPGGYSRTMNYITWIRRYVGDKSALAR